MLLNGTLQVFILKFDNAPERMDLKPLKYVFEDLVNV